jgi:hypothetical protein
MDGQPLKPVGQIIFDVNGGTRTRISRTKAPPFSKCSRATRPAIPIRKPGFEVMKLNFHGDIEAGFGLLQSFLAER